LPSDLGERPSATTPAPRAADDSPNVVLITADDMDVDDVAHMPHLQRLIADQGVTLTEGLAPTPICVPARASLLTGQYAHNHGALTIEGRNGGFRSFAGDDDTLPVWLQRSGYDTLFVGKYLNGYGVKDETYVPPGWSDFRASIDFSTYSFTDTRFNANGRVVKPEGYNTDVIADMTTEMLSQRPDSERPFYLWANYVAPHTGGGDEPDDPKVVFDDPEAQLATTRPADRHRDLFDDEDLPDVPEMWRGPDDSRWSSEPRSDDFRSAMREVNQQRLESLQAVDEAIRDTVQALRKQGELDDTYVIVTSDNGFMTGHNNKMGKLLPFDNSVRIPILLRGPGLPRGVTTDLAVTNPDLAVTIAALAGAEPGRTVDGADVSTWLAEGRTGHRIIPIEAWPVGGARPKRRIYSGIRYGSYTYVVPRGGRPELYDRSVDPGELRNLADDPAYAPVVERLAEWDERYRDCAGATCPTGLEQEDLQPTGR